MKRIFTTILVLACLTGLLAGCAGKPAESAQPTQSVQPTQSAQPTDSPQGGQKTYTVDEIGRLSSPEQLLSRHSALTYVHTYTYGDGGANTVIRGQYTVEDGFLRLNTVSEYGTEDTVYYSQFYADGTYAGAQYNQTSDGQTYLILYESADSYQCAVNTWLASQPDSGSETIVKTSMQDGAVVVTTRKQSPDEAADRYEINLYFIDPETDDLLYMESNSYQTEDDSLISSAKTDITYDTPVAFDVSPFETITGSSDYCEVNLIRDPQTDDMTALWYPVVHGTVVIVAADEGTKLYGDEDLTQELDPAAIDISGSVRNIFVVRAQ